VLPNFGFDLFTKEVALIIAAAVAKGIRVTGWDGTGQPHVDTELVSFNGDASRGIDCETCHIPRVFEPEPWMEQFVVDGLYRGFCKTNRHPYDAVVVAVLLSFQHHFPTVRLSSDGGPTQLTPGGHLYMEVTGRDPEAALEAMGAR
jgi:hypothetical protein